MNNNANYNAKKICGVLYFHKSNDPAIKAQPCQFHEAYGRAVRWMVSHDKSYEVVKYNTKTQRFSLIDAVEWNELYEPIVGASYNFDEDGVIVKIIPNNKQVYHQKHLFVTDDYNGFSCEESIKRTKIIEALPEIKEIKNIKSRIGSLSFWGDLLDRNNLPVYMEGCTGDNSVLTAPYTLHGVELKPIEQMNKFVEGKEYDLFIQLRNILKEFDVLRKLLYKQITTEGMSTVNRIISKLMKYTAQHSIEMLSTLYKPWCAEPWMLAQAYLTLDDKFMIRKYNGNWYALPIIEKHPSGVITTKVPENFCWEERPEAFDSVTECMIAHFMERMRMFNLTAEQNAYFK